jgi:YesN/AraC family two-component response regulator
MGRNVEIVIVDDEVMITDLIESFVKLSTSKVNVHCFNDAVEAHQYIQGNAVDVLITDYKMPDYNGIELMEITKPQTKRILISGYVSEIAEEKLNQLNAIFFEKPVPMKKLGKLITEHQAQIA